MKTTTSSFTLTILANAPPSFASALADQNYASDAADNVYTLPGTSDPDTSSLIITVGSGLPSFITLVLPNIIDIKPNQAGVSSTNSPLIVPVTVYLSDSVNSVTYTFNVIISYAGGGNTAPYFTGALVNQTVNAGGTDSYILPLAIDD